MTTSTRPSSPAATSSRSALLFGAVRAARTALVYDVRDLASVLHGLRPIPVVDGRGGVDEAGLRSGLMRNGPLVVLLGAVVTDAVREALDEAVEAGQRIIALTPARAPTPALRALFPLSVAAVRLLGAEGP